MDLEEFAGLDEITRNPTWSKTTDLDPGSILKQADGKWYIKASRTARWMDLLGDYAGSEPFIIDGTSHHLQSLPPTLLRVFQVNPSCKSSSMNLCLRLVAKTVSYVRTCPLRLFMILGVRLQLPDTPRLPQS